MNLIEQKRLSEDRIKQNDRQRAQIEWEMVRTDKGAPRFAELLDEHKTLTRIRIAEWQAQRCAAGNEYKQRRTTPQPKEGESNDYVIKDSLRKSARGN